MRTVKNTKGKKRTYIQTIKDLDAFHEAQAYDPAILDEAWVSYSVHDDIISSSRPNSDFSISFQ